MQILLKWFIDWLCNLLFEVVSLTVLTGEAYLCVAIKCGVA